MVRKSEVVPLILINTWLPHLTSFSDADSPTLKLTNDCTKCNITSHVVRLGGQAVECRPK